MDVFAAVLIWAGIVVVSMLVIAYLARRWGHDAFGWLLLTAVIGPLAIPAMVGARQSRQAPAAPATGPRTTVLAAVDGSDASARVARHAAAIAGSGGLTLITVLPHEARDFAASDRDATIEKATSDALQVLRESGRDADVMVRYGNAGEEIVGAARERGAAVIVIGRRGAGLTRALLGSVSDYVVRNAGTSVAVIE